MAKRVTQQKKPAGHTGKTVFNSVLFPSVQCNCITQQLYCDYFSLFTTTIRDAKQESSSIFATAYHYSCFRAEMLEEKKKFMIYFPFCHFNVINFSFDLIFFFSRASASPISLPATNIIYLFYFLFLIIFCIFCFCFCLFDQKTNLVAMLYLNAVSQLVRTSRTLAVPSPNPYTLCDTTQHSYLRVILVDVNQFA